MCIFSYVPERGIFLRATGHSGNYVENLEKEKTVKDYIDAGGIRNNNSWSLMESGGKYYFLQVYRMFNGYVGAYVECNIILEDICLLYTSTKLKIQTFVATLATQLAFAGVTLVYCNKAIQLTSKVNKGLKFFSTGKMCIRDSNYGLQHSGRKCTGMARRLVPERGEKGKGRG